MGILTMSSCPMAACSCLSRWTSAERPSPKPKRRAWPGGPSVHRVTDEVGTEGILFTSTI